MLVSTILAPHVSKSNSVTFLSGLFIVGCEVDLDEGDLEGPAKGLDSGREWEEEEEEEVYEGFVNEEDKRSCETVEPDLEDEVIISSGIWAVMCMCVDFRVMCPGCAVCDVPPPHRVWSKCQCVCSTSCRASSPSERKREKGKDRTGGLHTNYYTLSMPSPLRKMSDAPSLKRKASNNSL